MLMLLQGMRTGEAKCDSLTTITMTVTVAVTVSGFVSRIVEMNYSTQ